MEQPEIFRTFFQRGKHFNKIIQKKPYFTSQKNVVVKLVLHIKIIKSCEFKFELMGFLLSGPLYC